MIGLYGLFFYRFSRIVALIHRLADVGNDERAVILKQVSEEMKKMDVKGEIADKTFPEALNLFGLTLSRKSLQRYAQHEKNGLIRTIEEIRQFSSELDGRLKDELESVWFMYLPKEQADLYNNLQPFGSEVNSKFPNENDDIEEAAKCLATKRSTATVFHLMRVMEAGVQSLGAKLGIQLTQEKVWQNILEEINKAINKMKPATSEDKELQASYAESSAYLFNVKLAWRNPVMHPKAKYTEEEAEQIFLHVKTFMRHLATKIL